MAEKASGEQRIPLTLDEALDKVEARFLYNLPAEELSNNERLFFQIEQAHWFYEDFIADDPINNHLPKFKKLQYFAERLFHRCPLLKPLKEKLDMLFSDFCNYRYQIPVCGCILVNPELTHVVLVRNWAGNSWSWPKGKINEGESPYDCAIRETLEETGYNAGSLCNEEDFIVVAEDSKMSKLYIAVGVPNDTVFETQTRKEISKVEFHPINQLPKKIWGVQPFIPKLERFLRKLKRNSSRDINTVTSSDDEFGNNVTGRYATNIYDDRNSATFGEAGTRVDSWSVDDMFTTNSKITGLNFTYDGNPHSFGSRHPSYVNYLEKGEGTVESISSQAEIQDKKATSNEVTRTAFPKDFKFDVNKILSSVMSINH